VFGGFPFGTDAGTGRHAGANARSDTCSRADAIGAATITITAAGMTPLELTIAVGQTGAVDQ